MPIRAAVLTGSAARGDADFFSDLDLLVYVDELPAEEFFGAIRRTVNGRDPVRRAATEHFVSEEFDVGGVRTEVSFVTVARVESRLEQLLTDVDDFDSPSQKILSGVLESLSLHGHDLVEAWRARAREYPESLRRPTIERHWSFFPLWYHAEALSARDAELWRLDTLLEGAFNLLAVVAALNRVYFARFELKRMRTLIDRMELAPARLAERLESLFRLEPTAAAAEFGRLVEETRTLVASEFPELELSIEFPVAARKEAWAATTRD